MVSRRIETVSRGGDEMIVHWAPELALAWSCVHCRRSWVRDTDWDAWRPTGGSISVGTPVPATPDTAWTADDLDAPVKRPKVPVCRACGKAEITLDKDGRVKSHADAEGSLKAKTKVPCRGRGYMPRWT